MKLIATAIAVVALAPAQLPPLPPLPPLPVPLPPPPPSPDVCSVVPIPLICLPPPAPPGDDPPQFTGPIRLERQGRYLRLRWPPARDDVALAGYRFYRDGNYIGRRGPTIVTIRFIIPCGRHRFRVEAVDSAEQTVSGSVRVRRAC